VALSFIISEIKRDIGRKSQFFHTPAIDDLTGGSVSEYCHKLRFGVEKLEWRSYHVVKKFEIMFSRFNTIRHLTDGQTDILLRHNLLLCRASRGKKRFTFLSASVCDIIYWK